MCQAVRPAIPSTFAAVGTDFAGNLIGLGDPRAQAEQAMKNVEQLLKEAEATSRISSRPPLI
ncbi:hypothetical protein [Klebsiella pneumoniae]|uniref:hypothetical protein n=1 Tax=Klebsiella pneumoniae TaxID=573 RepID=UPI00388D1A85